MSAVLQPREREIQAAVLDYLNGLWGIKVWRANTGAFTGEYNGRKRFTRFGQKGQADITGCVTFSVNGVQHACRLEVEIKRPGKKPTFEQAAWLGEMSRMGCIAFWCDSLKSASQQLEYEYARRGWVWNANWTIS